MSSVQELAESGLTGARVRLTAEEGEYVGTVHAVDARDGAVTLVGVSFDCGGHSEPVRGAQKFLRGDVRKISVLEAGPDAPTPPVKLSVAKTPRNDRMVMARGSRDAGRPPPYTGELVDDSLLLSQMALLESDDDSVAAQRDPTAGDNGAEDSTSRAASPPPLLPRPSGFALIDSASGELAEAVEYLLTQQLVGVAAEGVLLGRAGTLSLLTLASAELVFVVDVVALGEQAVETLRPLLQSSSVLKIIHDCRALSDLLAHQHNIKLANVYDTQVAEVYLYHELYGKVPSYVPDLNHILVRRLGLLHRQMCLPRYRLEHMAEDQQVWLKRPLSESLLEGAVKNAVYLRELRHVQVERMFQTYCRCVDVYLGAVRDGDDEDAASAPFESHRLPVAVQRVLDEPPKVHAHADVDPLNPRLQTNVQSDVGAPVGFTRNVWRHSAVK